jgi:hypothetical protein
MHRSQDCTAERIPNREATFRSIVNKHLRSAPAPVNAVLDWMDFGDEEEDFVEGSSG